MFEQAARLKLRFPTVQGAIMAEDLWDVPLSSERNIATLNTIAVAANHDIVKATEEDFINPGVKTDKIAELRFSIVMHVIEVRKTEIAAAKARLDAKAKNQKIREIIESKGDASLERKSIKALQDMLVDV